MELLRQEFAGRAAGRWGETRTEEVDPGGEPVWTRSVAVQVWRRKKGAEDVQTSQDSGFFNLDQLVSL